MENPNDHALAQLEHDWPRWQIWIVYRVIGGPVWCARKRTDHRHVINADSAEHLAEELEYEVSEPMPPGCGRCGQPAPEGNDLCGQCEDTEGREALAALSETVPSLDTPMTGDLLRDLYPAWTITRDEVFGVWQAERRRGSEVRFLAAVEAWELALKIKAAALGDKT